MRSTGGGLFTRRTSSVEPVPVQCWAGAFRRQHRVGTGGTVGCLFVRSPVARDREDERGTRTVQYSKSRLDRDSTVILHTTSISAGGRTGFYGVPLLPLLPLVPLLPLLVPVPEERPSPATQSASSPNPTLGWPGTYGSPALTGPLPSILQSPSLRPTQPGANGVSHHRTPRLHGVGFGSRCFLTPYVGCPLRAGRPPVSFRLPVPACAARF